MNLHRRNLLKGASAAAFLPGSVFALASPRRVSPIPPIAASPEVGARSLNTGWRFHLGDVEPPRITAFLPTYQAVKAGNAVGAAATAFDDDDWRVLDLPHDWAVELAPVETENLAHGFRPQGVAWYRRTFRLSAEQRGRYFELRLGPAATNATVWFNGSVFDHSWSGYSDIDIDISSAASFGDDLNTIAIRVDADAMEGWWYEGAGLYRDAWLVERPPIHIISDGVHADPREDASGGWRIPVTVDLYSIEEDPHPVSIVCELLDGDTVISERRGHQEVRPLEHVSVDLEDLTVTLPRLWSIDEPNLYRVRTRLVRDGEVVDERTTPCGFRTISFEADTGFYLNGDNVKIKGVCIHQDHAGLGVAVPAAIIDWRVRQLKAMGCNAIRSSHHAPHTALLDSCDRLGMLVMNENRNFNPSPDYMEQLQQLVRRDRNRPCVFMWSIFNEEPIQGTERGYEMVRRMAAAVRTLDDSRPVTAAMNGGMFAPVNVSQAIDVLGFNYNHRDYDRYHQANPGKPMLSSEDTSAFMTRGEWVTDREKQTFASDDTAAASWGLTQRQAWKEIDSRPFVAGAFVWTGFDYHGEPSPLGWPSVSSYFGVMDLCGFPKAAFFMRQALWIKDRPILHVLPHWNFEGREGETLQVMVATNLERVELKLNGRTVGDSPVDPYDMVTFAVPYAPGHLEAFGYRAGALVARHSVETTGVAVSLRLTVDRSQMVGDGFDAQPIRIEALDRRGRPVPTANMMVDIEVANGRLIGVGNGDPTSHATGKESRVTLFNGLAQAIVQGPANGRGDLSVAVSASGLRGATVGIGLSSGSVPMVVTARPRLTISAWKQTPVSPTPWDPQAVLSASDNNSWAPVSAGSPPETAADDGFVMMSATARLNARMRGRGTALRLTGVQGRAALWVNGVEVATKTEADVRPMEVDLPAGPAVLDIRLMLSVVKGVAAGLPGVVFAETL